MTLTTVLETVLTSLRISCEILSHPISRDPIEDRKSAFMKVKLVRDFLGSTKFRSAEEVDCVLEELRVCEEMLNRTEGMRSKALCIVITLQRYLENAGDSTIDPEVSHETVMQDLLRSKHEALTIFLRQSGGNARITANNFRFFNTQISMINTMLQTSDAP